MLILLLMDFYHGLLCVYVCLRVCVCACVRESELQACKARPVRPGIVALELWAAVAGDCGCELQGPHRFADRALQQLPTNAARLCRVLVRIGINRCHQISCAEDRAFKEWRIPCEVAAVSEGSARICVRRGG